MCTRRLAMEHTQWDGPCVCSPNSASVPPQILLLTVPRSKDPDSGKAADVADKETRNGGGGAVVVDVVRLAGAGFGRAFGKWKVEIAVLGSKLGQYSSVIHARFQACCPPAFTSVPSAFFASTVIEKRVTQSICCPYVGQFIRHIPSNNTSISDCTRVRAGNAAVPFYPTLRMNSADCHAVYRLDEMHVAFTRYFGSKLGPSPIAAVHLHKILDLGPDKVPNGEKIVKGSAQLVKPGVQTGGPGTRLITSKVVEIWESRSADMGILRKYAGIMTSMGYFPRVHGHKISMPFDGTGSDDATNELGLAMKKSWTQLWETLGSRFVAEGITEAMIQEQREEICAKDCKATMDIMNRILYIFGQLVAAEDECTEGIQRFKGR
ncbi:hypothetical protein B0H14DRAFT_2587684 [Mycena olivaceomarginata]|nr:hypothetical protein B0H14DRAFT_2587684 [Mycena olivaceomarginata]